MPHYVHGRKLLFLEPGGDTRGHTADGVILLPARAPVAGQVERVYGVPLPQAAGQRTQVGAAPEQPVQQEHRLPGARCAHVKRVGHRPLCLAAVFATMPDTINDRNSACVNFTYWPWQCFFWLPVRARQRTTPPPFPTSSMKSAWRRRTSAPW